MSCMNIGRRGFLETALAGVGAVVLGNRAAAAPPAAFDPYGAKMDGPPDKVAPVLRKLHDAGKAVIGMKIIGEGNFRSRRWILP